MALLTSIPLPMPIFVVSTLLILGYLLYQAALPKPIPGVPYHKDSARRGLDIMLRRPKDFDRCDFFADVFGGTIPNHHMLMRTNDRFKAQRKLLADTMTPSFLNSVASPHFYSASLHLINLWRLKSTITQGRPFNIFNDIHHMALDSIWAVAFGTEINTVNTQREGLEQHQMNGFDFHLPVNPDQSAELPTPKLPDSFEAIMTLSHGMESAALSPFPRLTHWAIRRGKDWREAKEHKDRLVHESLDIAKSRLLASEKVTCATDHLVFREQQASKKEGRAPEFDSPAAKDELLGFLVAGHETTATTIQWAMKLLADHPEAQSRLRAALYNAYPGDYASGTIPDRSAISATAVPYLDAVIEEVLRCGQTFAGQTRQARRDTIVLGHTVPAGTDVFLLSNGPGFVMPDPFSGRIMEENRSESSRETKGRTVPEWDSETIGAFMPERWLKDGDFDGSAGPNRQFGAGERGCFGRKMGLLKMRILFTLVFWCFELPPLPENLSGYSALALTTRVPVRCYGRPRWLLQPDVMTHA
ncbi:cytochrome P450 [Myriangium duriaei CBS 260.36]|uniref:Cytochrome P450 n=1 Tax=Myriangium duriaei CBS 260.36 TaxID=1168546 RepID=A0A9P4J700_9PEZI|nr:cytochrome P450 [Myriangium duriaei CBS 260.36]